jgi:pimeloyl-ACP methyl ester carboxylesterase
MGDRFLLWLGAGAVCAGVTVGMLLGAGTASAQTESDGDGGAKTSQSANNADNKQDSTKPDSATPDTKPNFVRDAARAIDAVKDAVNDAVTRVVKSTGVTDRATVAQSNVATTVKPESGQRVAKLVNNVIAAVTPGPDRKIVVERTRHTEPVETPVPVEAVEPVETGSTLANRTERFVPLDTSPDLRLLKNVRETVFAPKRTGLTLATPMLAQPQAVAVASPQIDVPPVISAIGTAVFGLISLAESVIEGPPKALPGSGVTVKRSTLKIGDQEVPADWYFPDTYDPDSATPPQRIIYLQHGFLARGVFYDYTASYLAKETNSVVVAPTLTSNIFATDGMWLGGDQMHRAVADLFLDDNPALLDSAQAAGYGQDQLPGQVVLVGHSLGGGLVIDTARYMKQNGTSGKLAGVVMLDGVSFTDPVPILKDLDGIPVYNLSSTPNPWNLFGAMDYALAQTRGGQPTGAQLLGSWHSDAMVGGNPLIQLGAYLLTGYGGPANVEGSQILAAGWINDLFAGTTDSGFYGSPGSTITIPTPAGPAIGLIQPTPGPITSVGREVTAAFFGLLAHINFATDVHPAPTQAVTTTCSGTPSDSSPSCTPAIAA